MRASNFILAFVVAAAVAFSVVILSVGADDPAVPDPIVVSVPPTNARPSTTSPAPARTTAEPRPTTTTSTPRRATTTAAPPRRTTTTAAPPPVVAPVPPPVDVEPDPPAPPPPGDDDIR